MEKSVKEAAMRDMAINKLLSSKQLGFISGRSIITIPQGSVLGSLLFVIYINDLPEKIDSGVFLFADDTKVLRQISSADEMLSRYNKTLILQGDDLTIGFRSSTRISATLHPSVNLKSWCTRIDIKCGNEHDHVFEEKDLGVTIDFE